MLLTLVRHGKAVIQAPSGMDADRDLRPKGHRQADFVGKTLAELAEPPEVIVSSPYKRAWETAEHIATWLGLTAIAEESLAVGCPPSELLDVIAQLHSEGHTALCLVGHNPTMEESMGVLLDGPGGSPVRVRTGEAFRLEIDADDPIGGAKVLGQIRLEED
ncbi:MAG: hypothetical protein DHS20C14_13620 [Phycisphaeraceae bacterium]|nr:MAG: hypothetical protein DHS20C14_13620 [Phycisphaeraceae bacterium]